MAIYHCGAGLLYCGINTAVVITTAPVVACMVKYLDFGSTCILAHLDECGNQVRIGIAGQFGGAVPAYVGLYYNLVAFLYKAFYSAKFFHCGLKHFCGLAVHDCGKVGFTVRGGCRGRHGTCHDVHHAAAFDCYQCSGCCQSL